MLKKLIGSCVILVLLIPLISNAKGVSDVTERTNSFLDVNKDSKNSIPISLEPNSILTFDKNLNPIIKKDPAAVQAAKPKTSKTAAGQVGRAAEDAIFEAAREAVKDLPVTHLDWDLPAPTPGLYVMYGSDGFINRYWYEDNTK